MDNQQHFEYQGWSFRHQEDGSLIIEPQSDSKVFSDPKSTMQPITLSSDDVYRLIGYALTGDLNNTTVQNSLREQYSKQLVK